MDSKSAEMLKKLKAYNCIANGCDIGEPELETELQTRFPSLTQTVYHVIRVVHSDWYTLFITTNKDEAYEYLELLRLIFDARYWHNGYSPYKGFKAYITHPQHPELQLPDAEYIVVDQFNAEHINTILTIVNRLTDPDERLKAFEKFDKMMLREKRFNNAIATMFTEVLPSIAEKNKD